MVKSRKFLNYFLVIPYFLLPFSMYAQQSFNGGGIGIKNSFGSVEFSMGQVDYGVSNTIAGIQSMGIQQPYFVIKPGAITSLLCDSLTFVGDAILEKEEYMGGVFIAYKGGNGGFIKGSNINSLNENGLVATIHPTNLAKGNGLLEISISGVPSGIGLAYFNISVGGKNCLIEVPVKEESPIVSNVNCGNILVEPPAIGINQAFNGKINIQYSKTNGKTFPTDTISIKNPNASFKLMSSKTKLALDEGVLTFDLIGKADKKGWLEFKLKVADKECPVRIIISEDKMEAPNFFSPTEAGVNEYWYVPALAFYPKAKIIIFDRYGKIISSLNGTQSWNGTMNGIPMPSGDYWYTVQLDSKLPPLKGNITLIR